MAPTDDIEILSEFPSDVSSTVAVSIVSSFSSGNNPKFDSKFAKDWVIQVVAYSLSLPTMFKSSLSTSMQLFKKWISDEGYFGDKKSWNVYARRVFRYLSMIFEFSNDTFITERVSLINDLLDDFEFYKNKLNGKFEYQTWNELVRILIGASDYLETELPVIKNRKELCIKCFSLLFNVIEESKLTSKEIWETFKIYTKKWSIYEDFLDSWSTKVVETFDLLLNNLFDKNHDQEHLKLIGFHLNQFVHYVDLEPINSKEELHKYLSKLISNLYKKAQSFNLGTDNLYKPKFVASIFFQLFGSWCFELKRTLLPSHVEIIKTLMIITDKWYVNEEWSNVIISMILNLINDDEQIKEIKQSIIANGHYLLNQYVSKEISSPFNNMIDKFEIQGIYDQSFLCSCAELLHNISEIQKLNVNTIIKYSNYMNDIFSKLDVLFILLKQDVSCFIQTIQNILNESKSNYNTDLLTTICFLLSCSPYFLKLINLDDFMLNLVDYVKECNNIHFTQSFLILVISLSKWGYLKYNNKFVEKLFNYLVELKNNGFQIDNYVQHICQYPINRTYQKIPTENSVISFMIGNETLCTIYNNNDGFIIHIRNPLGIYIWELNDVQNAYNFEQYSVPQKLDEIKSIAHQYIETTNHFTSDEINIIKEKIEKSISNTQNYTNPSNHYSKPYLANHINNPEKLRHKAIDFFIQTGLSNDLYKLEDDIDRILHEFDEITDSYVIQVPVYHSITDGFINERTPLLNRFFAFLGPENQNKVPNVELGLLHIEYTISFSNDNFVAILFNESSLALDFNDKSFPKNELLFIVTPYNDNFYQVSCKCKDKSFWSPVLKKCIVSASNLSFTISTTIFNYVSLHKIDLIFAKDLQRKTFLQKIQKKKISNLNFVDDYNFESLRS